MKRILLLALFVTAQSLSAQLAFNPERFAGKTLPPPMVEIQTAVRAIAAPSAGEPKTLEIYFTYDAHDGAGPTLTLLQSIPVGEDVVTVDTKAASPRVKTAFLGYAKKVNGAVIFAIDSEVRVKLERDPHHLKTVIEGRLEKNEIVVPTWSAYVINGDDKGAVGLVCVYH